MPFTVWYFCAVNRSVCTLYSLPGKLSSQWLTVCVYPVSLYEPHGRRAAQGRAVLRELMGREDSGPHALGTSRNPHRAFIPKRWGGLRRLPRRRWTAQGSGVVYRVWVLSFWGGRAWFQFWFKLPHSMNSSSVLCITHGGREPLGQSL